MQRKIIVGASVAAALLAISVYSQAQSEAQAGPPYVEFESGHVRPVALSADGKQLFAVNTPNASLEIFNLTGNAIAPTHVPVGIDPVAVAVRNENEVWVVNHISDSISIVSLTGTPHVVRTLVVGDEPRDIVFAGTPQRAFITTAHRGQQRTDPSIARVPGAGDPQFTTPGIPRADVWVFDPANLDTTFGGTPLRILSVFTDTPRALAVSPDGNTVYVAGFKTGNQTTVVPQERLCTGFKREPCNLRDGTTSPGGSPGPKTNAAGAPAPEVGLIVKYNRTTQHWEDELQRNWDASVRFRLPDTDVFAVDANTLAQREAYAHVGTTLFNMAVNPVNGTLYVSNTESFNQVRFEGPGVFGGSTVQGHLAESRITAIADRQVRPRKLNKHIDYSKLAGRPGFDAAAKNHSLSMPLDMVVSKDGATLYVAAFGSSKVGVFPTKQLEDDTFSPTALSSSYIPVSGGGVSGLALDETAQRLYVTTRFDNGVKVIDLRTRQEIAGHLLTTPEPKSVVAGRPILYDATRFSGNGEATCASCHIFGDMDDLAWDLGNPDDVVTKSQIPIILRNILPFLGLTNALGITTPLNGTGVPEDFHPMKGPMTTQTLRGMRFSGAMHWRGDRSVGEVGSDPFNADISFKNFRGAFQGLIGSPNAPSEADMQRFADFQLYVLPPPNPVRNLDNSLTAAQRRGANFYSGARPSDGIVDATAERLFGKVSFNCNGCHTLDAAQGSFGTGGSQSFEGVSQIIKVPHLRNQYAKVGMFGTSAVNFFDAADSGQMGDQIRGFGFLADGTTDTLFRFFSAFVFRPTSNSGFPQDNPNGARRDMEQFMLAFDSDLAPIVGQQVTLTATNAASANARVDLLLNRAAASFTSRSLGGVVKECDVVATLVRNGRNVTLLYDPTRRLFISSDGAAPLSDSDLRTLAQTAGQEVTYTAATPGSGIRILGPTTNRIRRR
jgi:DNA-binding beta-propeller fold protein YncE